MNSSHWSKEKFSASSDSKAKHFWLILGTQIVTIYLKPGIWGSRENATVVGKICRAFVDDLLRFSVDDAVFLFYILRILHLSQ